MLICDGNVASGHAHDSKLHACLAICHWHYSHRYDRELAHMQSPCLYCTWGQRVPVYYTVASRLQQRRYCCSVCPGSAATTRAHHGVLHGCENHTHRDRTASNVNFRHQLKNPVSLHLEKLFFWDIAAIKYNHSEKLIDTRFFIFKKGIYFQSRTLEGILHML